MARMRGRKGKKKKKGGAIKTDRKKKSRVVRFSIANSSVQSLSLFFSPSPAPSHGLILTSCLVK